jgi:hypothetical protein
MTSRQEDPAFDLATQIRTELSDPAPEGFHFTDHVIRQDASLDRLAKKLCAHEDWAELERAVQYAIADTKDGWTRLKLLELVDRLSLLGAAPALLNLAQHPNADDPRSMFIAGRACEILLRLPLNLELRKAADEVCTVPLSRLSAFRAGAQRERLQQRPRLVEWMLLVFLMALALVGFFIAFFALERG